MQAQGSRQRSLQTITNVQEIDVYDSQTLPDTKSQQNQFQFPSTELPMPLIRNSSQAPQQRPPLQNHGHSRSSSFFSFRSKQSLSNQQSGHQRTNSMGTGDEIGGGGVSAPVYGSPPARSYQGSPPAPSNPMQYSQQQPQQPAMARTTSAQSPLARALSTQQNNQPQHQPQPLPAPPPLHPEIRSVVQLTAAHAHKIYFSGPLVRRIERQADGQRPVKDEGWSDVWAQLGGTTLSIWDMAQIQEASRQGREVPPTYVNTTDAFVQVLGAVTTPATATSPPKKYMNVLTLNTAGSNLLLFSCPSTNALMSWAAALRLSAWEKSHLEEIYTAHLIRITLHAPDAPSTLLRGRMEGWVRIRVAGQTDWKRMWMAVSASEGGPSHRLGSGGGGIGSVPTPVAPLPKKKRMSNLFSRDSAAAQPIIPMKSNVSMYASPKPKDKKKAILTLKDVTQAFAVYPERPELISRSTLIKVEGTFGDEDIAAAMRSREGWLLIMPELEGGLGQAAEMLKWVVALHDAFELYGRPQAWTWDPRNPISLMFAYPVGPNKDLLFLDRELAETLDPRDDRTSSVRSRLIGILLDRMRGHEIPPRLASSDKPPALPPIGGNSKQPQQHGTSSPGSEVSSNPGGPQLPPLSFADSTPSQPTQSSIPLTPITELSSMHTNGRAGSGDISYNPPRPQPVQNTHHHGQDKSLPDPKDASLLNRPLTSSPDPVNPPPAVSGAEPQKRSSTIQNIGMGSGSGSFDTPSINRAFQVQSRMDSNASSVSNLSRTHGDGTNNAVEPPTSPTVKPRPMFSPSAQAPMQGFNPAPTSAPVSAPASPPVSMAATGPSLVTVPVRSPSVLTSPHSASGHEDDARHISDRVSILTSPHSPSLLPTTLSSPYSPHGTLRSTDGRSSGAQASPPKSTLGISELPAAQAKAEEKNNLFNEAGALYYMQQLEPDGNDAQNQHRRVPTTIAEHDDDDDSSSSSRYASPQQPLRRSAVSPTSDDSAHNRKPPIRQSTPMAFIERSSSQGTSNKPASSSDRSSPSRQGLGRKPSGARAQATRSYNGDRISSQHVTEEEETQSENENDLPKIQMNQIQDRPSVSSDDPDLDALAALSYLAVEDKPSSPRQVNVEPLHIRSNKSPSPPPAPAVTEPLSQFKSSFAPSKQAAERKAKAQAQQAAHHEAVHKPGRANRKRKSHIAGAWNESSEEEEEDEEDDDDDDADSDAEPTVANRQGSGLGSSNASLRQTQSPPSEQSTEPPQQQYLHLRPPRTLPQIPGNQNYPDEHNPPPLRMVSDQYSGVPTPRMYHDGTQIRTQSEFPQPGAARQSVWSQVLDPGRAAHVEAPRNDTFVQLEPSETMTKAFTPQGLLSAGMQDKQDRSAKRQEELARETGASLINVPNKPPPPQMGLLGAITAHERERKREGGVGAALTEREREKRVAEERQRRFDEHQRHQLDQMQQGGSMYGGQFPANYMNPMMMMNPMMGMNPMMTGGGLSPMMTGQGMAPMMTGQMGYPGMMPGYNPQHMFAAQQAAQAYQQAMMAFSVAGSQVGGEGAAGTPPLNPAMTGGNLSAFDPRMSMMGMPMMGPMAPMGMQMTGLSTFDPRFPPTNSQGSMNDTGLAPPAVFGGQGQPPSRNSSPVGRGSPLARQPDSGGRSSRPESPKP